MHPYTYLPSLRSAAALNDLSLMHDHLTLSVPSPKHEFRTGVPAGPIGENGFLAKHTRTPLSPLWLPCAQMYQKRGKR